MQLPWGSGVKEVRRCRKKRKVKLCLAFSLAFIESLRFTQFGIFSFWTCPWKVNSSTCAASDVLFVISVPYCSYSLALAAQTINVWMSMTWSSCACTGVDSVFLPLHTTNTSVINRYRSKHVHCELFAHRTKTVSYTGKVFLLGYNYQGNAELRVHYSKNTDPSLNWGKHLQNASKQRGKDESRLNGITYQLQMQRRNSCLAALPAGPSPSCPFAHFVCRWAPDGSSCLFLGQ